MNVPGISTHQMQQVQLMHQMLTLQPQISRDPKIGLHQLREYCLSIYPQLNTHSVETKKSYIKDGGTDPLDYILIFQNEGDLTRRVPKHWHYIGFGLSDIYSYGEFCSLDKQFRSENVSLALDTEPPRERYPMPGSTGEKLSGFGFELTFRVKCNDLREWGQEPPKWPVSVMQEMARYVFQSKSVFCEGDHAAWFCSLDGCDEYDIEHMLMTVDPELRDVPTTHGRVQFIQLVGVSEEELQAARQLNAQRVLDLMREHEETGGESLVTDMRRVKSIFDLNSKNEGLFQQEVREFGSNFACISAKHEYSTREPDWYKAEEYLEDCDNDCEVSDMENLSLLAHRHNRLTGLKRSNSFGAQRKESNQSSSGDSTPIAVKNPCRMSYESITELMVENAELQNTRYHDKIYLLLSYESARVLPVALEGRLAHGKIFTIQSFKGDLLTTFIPEGANVESLVTREKPFAKNGPWLQVFVSNELREQMLDKIQKDFGGAKIERYDYEKRHYSWPDHKLYITVVDELSDSNEAD